MLLKYQSWETHGVMSMKFKMGNTIFIQEFVVYDNLVRPVIIGRDFTGDKEGH